MHLEALNAALEDKHLDAMPEHAPLIALCRTLAQQMDSAGVEPSTRLSASYLSALKDLRRAILDMPAPRPLGKLSQLRNDRPRPAPNIAIRRTGDEA